MLTEIGLIIMFFYKKKIKLFFLLFQFQIFLFVLEQILFHPQNLFQGYTPSPIALGTLIVTFISIEALILCYLIFQERIIKKLLFLLSLSTTLAVFLIVLFIVREGMPAFYDTTGPAEFITGTQWQPSYSLGKTESTTLITHIVAYDLHIHLEDTSLFAAPDAWVTIPFTISNRGGTTDDIAIDIQFEQNLSYSLAPHSPIALIPNDTVVMNLSVFIPAGENIYQGSITVTSQSSSYNKIIPLQITASEYRVDLSPSQISLVATGDELGFQLAFLQLKNTGEYSDTYTITLHAPDYFRPSIAELTENWNYNSSSAQITLEAGASLNLTVNPRLVSFQDGVYDILVTINSTNHPQVTDTSHILFHFKNQNLIKVDTDRLNIIAGSSVNYTITLNEVQRFATFTVTSSRDTWKTTLLQNGTMLLIGDGTINIGNQSTDTLHLTFIVESPESTQDETLETELLIELEKTQPTFGILPFIVGTLLTTTIAIFIAAPLGLGCAIFLSEFCPRKIRMILKPLYELLAGIPSVIFGLWGFFTFGPFLAHSLYPLITSTLGEYIWFFKTTTRIGNDVLTASIVLGIMILPIIITLSEDAIHVVRKDLKEGSLALGTTRWQTVKHIILPEAKSGIITSIILATGRAIGETMAVLMIMGAFYQIPSSLFDSGGTMTSVIAATLGWGYSYDQIRHALFAIGIVLFFLIFILNVLILSIHRKNKHNYSHRIFLFLKEKLKQRKKEKSNKLMKNTQNIQALSSAKKFKIVSDKISKNFVIIDSTHKKTSEDATYESSRSQFKDLIRTFSTKKALQSEKIIKIILFLCAITVTLFLVAIIQDIIVKGGLALKPEYLFQKEEMGGLGGGFANAITGSLQLVAIALAFAAPLSIGAAIYIQEYIKKDNIITKIILFASDTLASTPSIVFGAFGFMFFVIFLEFKISMIAGGLTLGIMVIPLLLRSSIESIKSIPREFQEGALALGATKWQTIRTVILPPAAPGITSGAIISMGRAIGETAAVMFTAGYSAHVATSIFQPTASMSNMIYLFYSVSAQWPTLYEKIYAVAFILIIMILALNAIARLVSYRASRMMKH
ncbi:MAG: phosphate ABC transporter permease subunit PstC [Candidatus Thermoplasmatota archaeon]|nr:phosphate ABC transporter permease subunit PstC [Candidatus Thermoplasmatota archaeon]